MASNEVSRIEALHNELVYLFSQISTANGYRTDPSKVVKGYVHPDRVTEHPWISVVMKNRRIYPKDAPWQRFNIECDIEVIGYIQADTEMSKGEGKLMEDSGDPLLHDLMQCLMAFMLTKVTNATNPWKVTRDKTIVGEPFTVPGQNKGWVALKFTVELLFTTTGVQ